MKCVRNYSVVENVRSLGVYCNRRGIQKKDSSLCCYPHPLYGAEDIVLEFSTVLTFCPHYDLQVKLNCGHFVIGAVSWDVYLCVTIAPIVPLLNTGCEGVVSCPYQGFVALSKGPHQRMLTSVVNEAWRVSRPNYMRTAWLRTSQGCAGKW